MIHIWPGLSLLWLWKSFIWGEKSFTLRQVCRVYYNVQEHSLSCASYHYFPEVRSQSRPLTLRSIISSNFPLEKIEWRWAWLMEPQKKQSYSFSALIGSLKGNAFLNWLFLENLCKNWGCLSSTRVQRQGKINAYFFKRGPGSVPDRQQASLVWWPIQIALLGSRSSVIWVYPGGVCFQSGGKEGY